MSPIGSLVIVGLLCGIASMVGGPIVAGLVGTFAPFIGAMVLKLTE